MFQCRGNEDSQADCILVGQSYQTVHLVCRLLGLAPEAQGQIFDLYQAVLEASIQRARKEGKYDEGIVDVKGTAVTLAQPPQVPPPPPPNPLTTRC